MHHTMKMYGVCVGIVPPLLTFTLDGGVWSVSRSCRFISEAIVPGTHWMLS
jgi:hypothetical protein